MRRTISMALMGVFYIAPWFGLVGANRASFPAVEAQVPERLQRRMTTERCNLVWQHRNCKPDSRCCQTPGKIASLARQGALAKRHLR